MLIYPAIDLYEGQVVRLLNGEYDMMTVYSLNPVGVARNFKKQGATHIHVVDLEGARGGNTPNFDLVCDIKQESGLFTQVGGGIRNMDIVDAYIEEGIDRVILGTAAVENPEFAREAVDKYGDKIAISVDIRRGYVATNGWRDSTKVEALSFCQSMQALGMKTVICTDITRDGAMRGANIGLYAQLAQRLDMNVIASGGVTTLEDVRALARLGIHGAIVGKAYYAGAMTLYEAIEEAK